jgi:hypothetical protein
MSKRMLPVAFLVSVLGSTALGRARPAVQRDVEGYAIAACLTKQPEPYLREQGEAWGSVIVERSEGDIEPFTELAKAVDKEVAKGDMAMVHRDDGPARIVKAPVLYCAEIIDQPAVAAAVDKAIKKLGPSYRRKK